MSELKLTKKEENEMRKEKINIFNENCERATKEHQITCPKCGRMATDQSPNGAGEVLEDEYFHCNCGWSENDPKMINLEMTNELFEIITEDINSCWTDEMCGNSKEDSEIYRKDFFERVLPTVKITLEKDKDGMYLAMFKYSMNLSERDFITLYNEIIWGTHEGYGAIRYDWFRERTIELCKYLIDVKKKYKLVSTLDDIKNLLYYMEK